MNESESKNEKPKENRRFSQKQYKFIKLCSKEGKKGIKRWNEWRKKHPDKDILLEGANLCKCYLRGTYLNHGGYPNLPGEVHLEGANFTFSNLELARLDKAHMENAELGMANLRGTILLGAHLEGASLSRTHLEGANLHSAYLQKAEFTDARLQGAILSRAHLEGAKFETAIVDGSTAIWKPSIDRHTNFCGVALDVVRIDPDTKQLLGYNIRRKNWEEWYPKHIFLRWPVRWFWAMSDYGISTWRIIGWFLGLSLFFAAIYSNIACWCPQGIVSNLTVEPHLPLWHYFILLLLRPIYFSVVTMTTLGFGDMYANANSIWGHLLLTIQVILGYVLLGALVTRFAVLFTAGGPAGKFADEKGEKDETE